VEDCVPAAIGEGPTKAESITNEETDPAPQLDSKKHELVWLTPENCQIGIGNLNKLLVDLAMDSSRLCACSSTSGSSEPTAIERASLRGAFVVCAFPASHPEQYLSVRAWDEKGDETEIGLIRSLDDWPEEARAIIRASLNRRYLLRRIERIHRMELAHGFLEFDVQTNRGREQFTMRWSQSHAQDFGEQGKLISDTEDNRYVIPDVDQLPKPDRQKFRQHVYW
jgi:hypothetical protein